MDLGYEYLRQRMPSSQHTETELESIALRQQLKQDIQDGMTPQEAIAKATETGKVNQKQALSAAKKANLSPSETMFKSLSPKEAMAVMKVASPDEEDIWQPILDSKIAGQAKTAAAKKPTDKAKIADWQARVDDAKAFLESTDLTRVELRALLNKHLQKTLKGANKSQMISEELARFSAQARF
jgi:hypothetical protein